MSFLPATPWPLVTILVILALTAVVTGLATRRLGGRGRRTIVALNSAIGLLLLLAALNPTARPKDEPAGSHLAVVLDVSRSVQRERAGDDWADVRGTISGALDDVLSGLRPEVRKASTASLVAFARGVNVIVRQMPLGELPGALSRLTMLPDSLVPTLQHNIFGALAIFLIFYLVARIVQRLAANLLATIGFDKLPEILGFKEPKEDAPTASTIAGYIVLTVILFIGTVQAFNTLDLEIVSNLANELLQGLFKILVAGVIFAVGLFLSNLAHKAITASGQEHAKTLALVARVAILIFTGAMALYRTDLAPEIVNHAFTALIFGLAIAAALAFGLGGRDAAARAIEGWTAAEEEAKE